MVLNKPYEFVSQGSVYTESAIEYNDLYLQLFHVSGDAGDGDFLLFSYYEVSSGGVGIVTMDVLLDSATVYVVVVFVIGDILELLDSRLGSNDVYLYSFALTSGETYGVAVFGHKVADNIVVEIGFTVAI